MNRLFALMTMTAAVAAWIVLSGGSTAAQNKEQQARPKSEKPALSRTDEHRKFMRAKLTASSNILEGLSIEDFSLIEKGAKELQRMSKAEEWQVSNDPMYRQHSNQFRRVADQLEKKAKEKDLDGAALAWVEGTLTCIECHKWVRAVLIAQ